MIRLFLDDKRMPREARLSGVNIGLLSATATTDKDWVIVRNFDEFVNHLQHVGVPDLVSFDHDLTDKAMHEYFRCMAVNEAFDYNAPGVGETGLLCARVLVAVCRADKKPLPTYFIHSANHLGAENIAKCLNDYATLYDERR